MMTISRHGARLTLALAVMIVPSVCAQAARGAQADKVLVSRAAVTLPAYRDIAERPLIRLYAPQADYERARADGTFVMERIVYKSDGLEVVALLYRTRAAGTGRGTIVFNRGSYIRQNTAPEYLVTFHRLAAAGYTVLAPMYRGSEGAAGVDQMGGAELHDLMQVAELAAELPAVNAQALFLLGESRGGMMVLQALRDGFPAQAAAVYGAPTDFFALFADDPGQYEPLADRLWPGWRQRRDEILGRRSAVCWARRIGVPLLILHGGADDSMPVTQSLALARHLEALGKLYELHIYAAENHMISGRAADRDASIAAWFRRHGPRMGADARNDSD